VVRGRDAVSGGGMSSWRPGLHRLCCSVLRFEQHYLLQRSRAAVPAYGDVDPGQTHQPLLRRFRFAWFRDRLSKQVTTPGELARPAAIGEQSKVAQPCKAVRQHVQEEAADELVGAEAHHLDRVGVGVVAPAEADVLAVEVDETVVSDGGLVG